MSDVLGVPGVPWSLGRVPLSRRQSGWGGRLRLRVPGVECASDRGLARRALTHPRMTAMRVAVTEGHAHLAEPLVRSLVGRGHEVVRLTRLSYEGGPGVTGRQWDPESGRISAPGLDDVDAVVNLHASSPTRRWTPHVREEIQASRITSTLTVVSALDPSGRCQRLLNLSSTAFYGDAGGTMVSADSPAGRGWLAGVIAGWEGAARHSPVPTALLRTPPVLARSGGYLAHRTGLLAGRLGSGRQFLPWIHVDDWTAAVELLLTSPAEGPVNLVAPQPTTEAEFVAERARAWARRPGLSVPDWLLDRRFGKDAATALWRTSTRAVPQVLAEQGHVHLFGTIREALDDLVRA